jgi:hypothetical protein
MITITRYFQNNKTTLGAMSVDGIEKPFYTSELPWKSNEQGTSCIPTGKYIVEPHESPSKGQCFSINVANREYILIHSGNIAYKNSRGCILVGLSTGYLKDDLAVLQSRNAMKILKEYIKEPTELIIKNLHV